MLRRDKQQRPTRMPPCSLLLYEIDQEKVSAYSCSAKALLLGCTVHAVSGIGVGTHFHQGGE